ncbi:MAG: hypothetical protein JWM93_688, partial [Frankiales bacterium]|nr:hypothetical protein [Frankiales bacterium]
MTNVLDLLASARPNLRPDVADVVTDAERQRILESITADVTLVPEHGCGSVAAQRRRLGRRLTV